MKLFEVAFPIPLHSTFVYGAADDFASTLKIGHRVLVPFRNRAMTGYVVGAAEPDANATYEIKPITAILDDIPLLTPSLIALAKKMAETYACSFGEAIQTVLPGGLVKQTKRKIFAVADKIGTPTGEGAQKLLARIHKAKALDFVTLAKREPKVMPFLRELENEGFVRMESVLGKARAVEQKETFYARTNIEALTKSAKQKAVLDFIQRQAGPVDRKTLSELGFVAQLATLVKKGLLAETKKSKGFSLDKSFVHASPVELSPEQTNAVHLVNDAIEKNLPKKFLLFGITGSGKTEVYLRATAKALAQGKRVLALVPEIALTPQFVGRFRARFGDRISVLHSARSESERLTDWKRIRRQETDIVIGARGAVFAPLDNIGLVIIDEEHDSSYKQEEGLTYHVKHLAYVRADRDQSVVLLGSATPSMESFELAKQGKLELLELRSRFGDFGLPNVEIVDLKKDFSKFGEKGLVSETLRAAILETLAKNQQVVLFLNRRGFAPLVLCPTCGESVPCPNCSVSLTYHQDKNILMCHYCDHTQHKNSPCMKCGQPNLLQLGIGTEKMEEELKFYFPDAVIERMDRDTTETKGSHEAILKRFAAGKTDILLGTQMVTKGLDVENVTLVGVLLADQSLHFPDFRAAETTFQLLTQVAGRAGRGSKEGKAIFQTFLPDNYAIVCAKEQKYEDFFNKEIEYRRELSYPPFSSLCLIEVSSTSENETRKISQWMREQAKKNLKDKPTMGISILGPAPCPIKKIKQRFRYQLLIRSARGSAAAKFSKWLVAEAQKSISSPDVEIKLNVDPYRFT